MPLTAAITNIARGSLHDGPGVRTVVYFKGCALRCRWCHNPETLERGREILFLQSKCIHCGHCVMVCPAHHVIRGKDVEFLREGCAACGKCAESCPAGALSLCGEKKSLEEVFAEVRKDSHYYARSGGGVTLSGGECLLQPEFAGALLEKCRAHGIGTAIESALFVPWENVERVEKVTDWFFLDFKHPDSEAHRQWTGQGNERILENIRRLSRLVEGRITIRIPMIPGVNDTPETLENFGAVISTFGAGVSGVELLRYNHLAESKYRIAGREYRAFAREPQPEETILAHCARLQSVLPERMRVFTKIG